MTGRVMTHHRAGLGYRAIGMWEAGLSRVAISRLLKVPRSTVGFWVKKFRRHGHLDRMSVEGRPRATSRRADRRLKRLCRTNRFSTSSEFLETWGENVIEQTLRNRLHQFALRSRRPAVCPFCLPATDLPAWPRQWPGVTFASSNGLGSSSRMNRASCYGLKTGEIEYGDTAASDLTSNARLSRSRTEEAQSMFGAPFAGPGGQRSSLFAPPHFFV